jgi:hypothetical protein
VTCAFSTVTATTPQKPETKGVAPSFWSGPAAGKEDRIMRQVLITISKGIIHEVLFFNNPGMAIRALAACVKHMNVEYGDAALYDENGLVANAKHFLDEHDAYCENEDLIAEVMNKQKIPPLPTP